MFASLRCIAYEIDKYIQPIDGVIQSKLVPAITDGHICSKEERKLLSLPCRYGHLGIPILKQIAHREFENSVKMALSNQIAGIPYKTVETQSMVNSNIETNREQSNRIKLDQIGERITEDQKKTNKLNKRLGSYKWFISEHNYLW